jgi:hypothetical protein
MCQAAQATMAVRGARAGRNPANGQSESVGPPLSVCVEHPSAKYGQARLWIAFAQTGPVQPEVSALRCREALGVQLKRARIGLPVEMPMRIAGLVGSQSREIFFVAVLSGRGGARTRKWRRRPFFHWGGIH